MKILGIETSCDETATAILEIKNSKIEVLSNVISSQVKLHAKYGGVVPNLAAREHVKNIERVFKLALKKARVKNFDNEIDLIAVTRGPGLGPSLLVGISFARALAWKYNKPLIGVNHLEGHIYSNWLKPIREVIRLSTIDYGLFPILNLIVSGGHTELVLMSTEERSASGGMPQIKYKVVGETLDDAVGEAFDKVARLLGLGYPGGPVIDLRSKQHEAQSTKHETKQKFEFPRPMLNSKNYDFSYAGLKTAVLYKVRELEKNKIKLTKSLVNQICYEFQKAALDVLILKTIKAAREYSVKSIFLSGGVSANKELRERLESEANKLNIKYSQPELEYTGDNAAMIALAGYFSSRNKKTKTAYDAIEMDANLGFEQKKTNYNHDNHVFKKL